jgi:hypothetical protein
MTQFTHFQVVSDFNQGGPSAKAVCYISHLPKMKKDTPQKQPHEVDEFILRGPEIEFEGFLDIRPEVIITTALELGMHTAATVETLQLALEQSEDARVAALVRAETAEARVDDLIVYNAEQIVGEAALVVELGEAYEDLYDYPDELDYLDEEA